MSELIKQTGNNAIVKKADNYLSHLGALLQKRYAPDLPEFIPYKKDGKWGFCDRDKNIVIECKYDFAWPYKSEYFEVLQGYKKYGINIDGTIKRLPKYNDYFYKPISDESVEPSLVFANEITSFDLEDYEDQTYTCNRVIDDVVYLCDGYKSDSNNKRGFANRDLQVIVEPKYDYIYDFSCGLASMKLGILEGYINKDGEEIVPPQYYKNEEAADRSATTDFSEGFALVWIGSKCGFIDAIGQNLTEIKYTSACPFKKTRAVVQMGNLFGFIDLSGKEVIPLRYSNAYSFSEGLALITQENQQIFIDEDGNEIIRLKTEVSARSFSEGLALVRYRNKYGFINKKGDLTIPIKYESKQSTESNSVFNNGLARISMNNKEGFINKNGENVVSCVYEKTDTYFEKVLVRMDIDRILKSGLANLKSINLNAYENYLEPYLFKFVSHFENGLAKVTLYQALGRGTTIIDEWYIDKLGNEYREK